MFILDSLMISGIRWALQTTLTAAEAEMNDDTELRDRLLEAEMRREMGEISDEEFRTTEADLLARIRDIRERREGTAALQLGTEPMEISADNRLTVEAELSGDFHERASRSDRSDRSGRSSRSTHAGGVGQERPARLEGSTDDGVTPPGAAARRKARTGAARPNRAAEPKRTGTQTTRTPRTTRTIKA